MTFEARIAIAARLTTTLTVNSYIKQQDFSQTALALSEKATTLQDYLR